MRPFASFAPSRFNGACRRHPGDTTDHAWNINGKVIYVSGGTIQLAYEETPYRTIFKPGMWTLDELDILVPQMMQDVANPAPPPPDLEVPGRPVAAPAAR